MKTWYLLAAAVAYYLYSQTSAQKLAAIQNTASNEVMPIDVSAALSTLVTATPAPTYSIPAVNYLPGDSSSQ
jgi:hypothetical protein